MPAGAHIYAQFFRSALHKEVNLESDTLKMLLTSSSYAFNLATDRYKSDVTNEISGTGYSAGGVALASVSVTDTGGSWTISAADITWSSATFTAAYAVLYDSTPASDATRPLIALYDFGGNKSVSAGVFTLQVNAGGLSVITPP